MTETAGTPLTGRKVALMMSGGFAIIIGVNLLLAFKAVSTFPGLETKNSYVASQTFDADRIAQLALNWEVSAQAQDGTLRLKIAKDGVPVAPKIRSAVFGRATSVADDQFPDFKFDGQFFSAPAKITAGNWNLRLIAEADDGTIFKQRIIVEVLK